jgi:blue copper oxidase
MGAGTLAAAVPEPRSAVPTFRWRADELCATDTPFAQALPVPGRDGEYARLSAGGAQLALRAQERPGNSGRLAFACESPPGTGINPTLLAARGERLRLTVDNALREPTVVHWHGLAVDTRNDGSGLAMIAPGTRFDYAFDVANRAALYWYHPHPHGATARQTHLGLFGLIEIEDDDERALRRALRVAPGDTELTLILQDRRVASAPRYAPAPEDVQFGWFGDEPTVNGVARPYHGVESRHYRLRIINASNARTYLLALRRDSGAALPLLLLGTDGGLLERAVPCAAIFLSPAERVDVLVDFRDLATGDFALLESRAFEPMQAAPTMRDARTPALPAESAAMHGATPMAPVAAVSQMPDGAAFPMLQFRVRGRSHVRASVPANLSRLPPLRATEGDTRPLRLGFAKNRWRINDRVFDMSETPIVVARDAVETWLIRNYHASAPHAMHLHGFTFRVLERETSPDALLALRVDGANRLPTDLGCKDTVLIWPGESVRVAIDFRHPFAGTQSYLFHCHNLEHEDAGMMLRVDVG